MRSLPFCLLFAGMLCGQNTPTPNETLEPLPRSAALASDTPAKVELGRLLFFDPILSATQDVACATCHHPDYGWADGRSTPLGVHANGIGPSRMLNKGAVFRPLNRNTPSVLNAAFNGIEVGKKHDPETAPMFWDNRVFGLEAQALVPVRSLEEMRGDSCTEAEAIPAMVARLKNIAEYVRLFDGEITAQRVADALAAFERTLITPDTPFDRYMRGDKSALSPAQEQGLQAFQRARCTLCHNGPMLSDFKLHAIGLSDTATQRHEFRTPTLRNLKHTAPYMHHGGSLTLEEVLLFYDRLMDQVAETLEGGDVASLPPLDPLLREMNMLPEDHGPIQTFLEALNSDTYDRKVPERVPSGLPVAGFTRSR